MLGHASVQITLDTCSHVAAGLQEAVAESFDKLVSAKYNGVCEKKAVEKGLLAKLLYVKL